MGQEDLPRIAEIEQEYPSPWTPAQLLSECTYADAISLVAENSSRKIIGWCTVRFVPPESELLKIAVRSDRRGEGIAGLLLEEVFQSLSSISIECIFLEVRSRNRSALQLYYKNGFVQVGERADYYSDPQDNALILKKDLV